MFAESTFDVEILPRLRFAERLALRSALELDDVPQSDALVAIAKTLATAQRWA